MNDILREVGRIYRCLDSIGNVEFKQFNLAKGQYAYLVRICERPGIIQERVSELLRIDRATASRAIQKLENSELVEKRNHPDNRRIHLLYPTEKGKMLYEILKDEENYSNQTALKGISEDEQRMLLKLLQKVQSNLEPEWALVKRGGQREYVKKYIDSKSADKPK